jgi:hypothetical protein
MRLALAFACVAAIAATAAVAAPQKAHVVLTSYAPASFRGTSFHARERVTLTVSATVTRTKTITANARGAFRATFAGLTVPRCQSYTVRARGNRGSLAVLDVVPECPQPIPSDQPLMPHDPNPKGH